MIWWHGRSCQVLPLREQKGSLVVTLPKSWAERAPQLPEHASRLVEVELRADGSLVLKHLAPPEAPLPLVMGGKK